MAVLVNVPMAFQELPAPLRITILLFSYFIPSQLPLSNSNVWGVWSSDNIIVQEQPMHDVLQVSGHCA